MSTLERVLLHALPLDGSMWKAQQDLLPGATHAPTLYGLGDSLRDWAERVLDNVQGDRLIVVGNSVGGSCALEMAMLAPERIAALVLIGTKAAHQPDPALQAQALRLLGPQGLGAAWDMFWAPLFAPTAGNRAMTEAKTIALRQSPEDIARGVTAFHTRAGREPVLPLLRCPVLCVSGEEDAAPGPATTQTQAERTRQGRSHIIPGSGHYVPMEQPERLNALLGELIDELSTQPSRD